MQFLLIPEKENFFMHQTFHRDRFTWLAYLSIAFYGYFLNVLGPITPFLKFDPFPRDQRRGWEHRPGGSTRHSRLRHGDFGTSPGSRAFGRRRGNPFGIWSRAGSDHQHFSAQSDRTKKFEGLALEK